MDKAQTDTSEPFVVEPDGSILVRTGPVPPPEALSRAEAEIAAAWEHTGWPPPALRELRPPPPAAAPDAFTVACRELRRRAGLPE